MTADLSVLVFVGEGDEVLTSRVARGLVGEGEDMLILVGGGEHCGVGILLRNIGCMEDVYYCMFFLEVVRLCKG